MEKINEEHALREEQAIRIKNKLHLLTFFITACEEKEPLEEDENEWHPDFEEAISSILFVNEHGYLEESEMHNFNDLFQTWGERFKKLGLNEISADEWKEKADIEDEIYVMLKDYLENDDS